MTWEPSHGAFHLDRVRDCAVVQRAGVRSAAAGARRRATGDDDADAGAAAARDAAAGTAAHHRAVAGPAAAAAPSADADRRLDGAGAVYGADDPVAGHVPGRPPRPVSQSLAVPGHLRLR